MFGYIDKRKSAEDGTGADARRGRCRERRTGEAGGGKRRGDEGAVGAHHDASRMRRSGDPSCPSSHSTETTGGSAEEVIGSVGVAARGGRRSGDEGEGRTTCTGRGKEPREVRRNDTGGAP